MASFSGGKRVNLLRGKMRSIRKAEHPARTLKRLSVYEGRVLEMLKAREAGELEQPGRQLRRVRSGR
jgi:hypothetical protein